MNKSHLAAHVGAETSATRADADRMVGAVFSAIADALAQGDSVAIAGFGKFDVRTRAVRTGRNPRTGESVVIAASKTPSFKAAKGPSRRDQRIAGDGRTDSPRPAVHIGFRDVCGREELGRNVEIRHTRECLRRSAVDIGPLARGSPYMASRRIAPTTALRASARG